MTNDKESLRDIVRQRYGEIALKVQQGQGGCCGAGGCDPITADHYSPEEAGQIPAEAFQASLGCGNPTALAELREGETVLDLGSGGGIDVLLSARRVGPTGFVYGLDMTDEMLALAEGNRRKAGVENVKFLKGHIEDIPLPEGSVDVLLSNCVINLSADKPKVLREAYRVLKPGGRFAVSDVVTEGALPDPLASDILAYVGCVAGALDRAEYERLLLEAGFTDVAVEVVRRYAAADLCSPLPPMTDADKHAIEGKVMGAFIRATKPLG